MRCIVAGLALAIARRTSHNVVVSWSGFQSKEADFH